MRNKIIDEVLKRNAQLFQNLGLDSTQKEINAAKVQLTKLAQDKAELAKVKKALATLLS